MLEGSESVGTVPAIALETVPRDMPPPPAGYYCEAASLRVVDTEAGAVPLIDVADHPLLEAVTKTATNGESYDMHVLSS